jgi:hypothetical protein
MKALINGFAERSMGRESAEHSPKMMEAKAQPMTSWKRILEACNQWAIVMIKWAVMFKRSYFFFIVLMVHFFWLWFSLLKRISFLCSIEEVISTMQALPGLDAHLKQRNLIFAALRPQDQPNGLWLVNLFFVMLQPF